MKTVKLTINGKAVEAPAGMNLLEAARSSGIPVEHFCYHRYLAVDGNCRTCMAEIEGPRGSAVAIACNSIVAEGMVARFDSEKAVKAQKSALEFLLLDHPLDCPVCDKAGECYLQDHYRAFGRYEPEHLRPRFFKGGKALDIGTHIVLDQERCVLCTRCIRFLDSVPQTSELCITHRGHEARLETFPGLRLDNPYSGNVTDVCPVGALTLKEFRFKQRVWYLTKSDSVCNGCSRGCNITVEHNKGRVWRFMPRENESLNLTWMCDEGRFSFGSLQEKRLKLAITPGGSTTFEVGFLALTNILKNADPNKVGAIASPWATCEDLFALKHLFRDYFKLENVAAILPPEGQGDDILKTSQKHPNEQGLRALGISLDGDALLKKIRAAEIDVLFILENELMSYAGDAWKKSLDKVKHRIVLSPYENATTASATLALPTTAYFEKDGTFVNSAGVLQRARRGPDSVVEDSMEASTLFMRLVSILGDVKHTMKSPREIFAQMAGVLEPIKGMTFDTLPKDGVSLSLPPIAEPPFKKVAKPRPNVVPSSGVSQ